MDNQVKIHGYRIELGEIEAEIDGNELVKNVVVSVCENKKNEKQLVAYIILNDPSKKNEFDGKQIQKQILGPLPDYMVPKIWIIIDNLPLLPNGKIDRKSLPNPDWDSIETSSILPPTTKT